MSHIVITITSSYANDLALHFRIALLPYFKFSLFNNICIDSCTFSCYIFIIELSNVTT